MSSTALEKVLVVLDTNVFLHFQPVNQIAWQRLFEGPIEVVACAEVIRELDEQKDKGNTRAKKDRARAALALIERAVAGPITLAEAATLSVVPFAPAGDDFGDRLSSSVPDDRILAAAVGLRRTRVGARVIVVSDDVGPRLKASALGLEARTLPDELRLKDEGDPRDAEIRRLTDRLRSIERTVPQPGLRFAGGKESIAIVAPNEEFLGAEPEAPESVIRRFRRLTAPTPPDATDRNVPPPTGPIAGRPPGGAMAEMLRVLAATAQALEATAEQVDAYNSDLDDFGEAYTRAHSAWLFYRDAMAEVFIFAVTLENTGTAPAEQPEVHLRVAAKHQADFDLLPPTAMPKPPSMPTPPIRPTRATAGIDAKVFSSLSFETPPEDGDLPLLDGAADRGSWLRRPLVPDARYVDHAEDGSHIRFGHQRLKHGFTLEFGPFALRRRSPSAKGCSLEFEIHADNLPAPVSGTLNVRVAVASR